MDTGIDFAATPNRQWFRFGRSMTFDGPADGAFLLTIETGLSHSKPLRLAQVYLSSLDRDQQLAALKKMEWLLRMNGQGRSLRG
ncbi:MAG: hypothetical protein R2825_27695 [Saprospiraceae bacterium]